MSIYPPDSDPEADSEASFADHADPGDDGATTPGLFDEAVAEHSVPAHYPSEPEGDVGADESSQTLPLPRLRSVLESLLFVADKPLQLQRLVEILEEQAHEPSGRAGPPLYQAAQVQEALVGIAAELQAQGRGIELHQVAGGWQYRTAPQNASWVQRQLQQKPQRLSRAQLETMTIIAYRQPITRPEIDDVRGVDSGGALKTLLERRLVRILGKKEEPGRPLLYGTTREFLEFFNLRDLKDLPTLREYYELNDENKARVRAAHPEGGLEGWVAAAASGQPATGGGEGPQQITLPQTGTGEPPDAAGSPAPPPTAPTPPSAGPPAPPAPPSPASLTAPISRVEILDQQLADDAEQLSVIDELIASVKVETPSIEVLLGMAEEAAQAETAEAASGPADESEEDEEDEEAADGESVAADEAGSDQPGSPEE
ncbi:MAG TPA: SMC-Scp complex subunit ScpB [Pseudomonadota bacterium]|nr:SMC-Scp complex subunit ScpB [Pseudomonadota bacterium]